MCLWPAVNGMPPVQCTGPIQTMAPRIRKVCDALSTIYELRGAMEAYLDDRAMNYADHELMDTGVKRQDVDHVFLRFGRRR
ncbi:myosuppressin [Ctenocephalides felis]|uniref:myosuppressin n=1 Tax=Ctenocephalides felis TaxID=7515 RepID=UPI000E6E5233|nr:myosuppressin [Ctenocephalides felis]